MSDELLPYYNRELSYIRRLGAEFAEAHPKIAARLRLGPDSSEDPHVERLIEAFAYLNARIRHKLEDDLPEISDAILGVLYPHYQRPIPSMAVVQLTLDPSQTELTSGYTVPREAMIETEPIQGEPCRFRTCYPVTLWPLEVKSASLMRPPFTAPATPRSGKAAAVLRLVLTTVTETVKLSTLTLDAVRFFLKGQGQHVYPLYELIHNNTIEVALATAADDPQAAVLDRKHIRPVGFERDEGMLPYPPRSFLGYRLLTEYFGFPEKFLFFDVRDIPRHAVQRAGRQLELYLYLNRSFTDLEQNLSADTFRLGCTPVVNLFRQRAEPIQLSHADWEYHVVPDARRPLAHEVYSLDRVNATSPDGEVVDYVPFFSVRHAEDRKGPQTFWFSTRRPAEPAAGQTDHGTEVYLSLVDLGFQPSAPPDWTVTLETMCLNRDLPHRLPFGGDQPRLQMTEGSALVSRITCLTPPTRTLRPALKHGALWRLVSHLTLNHLSITDDDQGADALREILMLYDFTDSAETRSMIAGIRSVSSRRVVGRAGSEAAGGFCRGVEVSIQFDEERFSGTGMFLFASVLERYLSLYCTVNSFTRLTALVKGREGELRRWPPRMGNKTLA